MLLPWLTLPPCKFIFTLTRKDSIIIWIRNGYYAVFRDYTEVVMKAVITVIGKDTVGILAKVSDACAQASVNIVEVTQSVLQDMFAMIMLVEIDKSTVGLDGLRDNLDKVGEATNTKIHVMHEDIFNSMHKI